MSLFRVALTGNIASGKSVVADAWEREGAAVIDADALARRAVAPGSPGLRGVVEAFGEQVVAGDGGLDRAALRAIVFADPAKRRLLETIVHPAVERLREEEEAVLEAAGHDVVVHVIPLLFEVGLERGFDAIVVVDSPEDVRVRRLVEGRGLDPAEARRMVAAQMPAARKREEATIVIDNEGTLAELEAQAREAWRRINSAAGSTK